MFHTEPVQRAELAVARVPLLLRAGDDLAVDLGVGHQAAAGPAVAAVPELDLVLRAAQVHPPVRRRLGHRPALHASCPAGRVTDRFSAAAPEVLGGVAAEPERLGPDVAVEVDVVRAHAEAGDLGEEAEVDVGGVGAGLEQHRVALRAELVGLLLGEEGVQPALDGRRSGWTGRRRTCSGRGSGCAGRSCSTGGSPVPPPVVCTAQLPQRVAVRRCPGRCRTSAGSGRCR